MFTRPPFPRSKVPPVKPQYIVLFKGDDSDFQGNQSVDIVIDTELDTTGMKAHFRFMDFVQDFDSIPDNKTLSLVFPNAKTSEFPLGAADATLRFEDASGKFRTVSNRIHIVVTNSVPEAYDNKDSQSITVTVKGTVTWDMIEGKPTFSTVATSGSYNDLLDKPTIPAPVTIDSALSQTSENPVQNKVVSKALYTGFTEWEFTWDGEHGAWEPRGRAVFYDGTWTQTIVNGTQLDIAQVTAGADATSLELQFQSTGLSATMVRHLVTPTKTSQLVNDSGFLTQHQDISGKLDGAAAYTVWFQIIEYNVGDVVSYKGRIYRCRNEGNQGIPPDGEFGPNVWEDITIGELLDGKQDALSPAQMGAVNSGATAAKVAAWDGYAAQIAQKADAADLPYRLVEPGKWGFSGSGYDPTKTYDVIESDNEEYYSYDLVENGTIIASLIDYSTEQVLSVEFLVATDVFVTATRASLPGHILDRANNLVSVTANTTLTLPPFVAGKVRDLLVACTIGVDGNSEPWSVIFQGADGEGISFKAEGDDAASATFPVPDAAGDWWYSLTERAPHVFAVSLKQLQSVSQQGGS